MYLRSAFALICCATSSILAAQPLDTDPPPNEEPKAKRGGILTSRAAVETRRTARQQAGFPAETQAAVDRALEYLAGQQAEDGSWGNPHKVQTTALALLAFLGNGVTPLSEDHGEAITNAILYLVHSSSTGRGRLGTRSKNGFAPEWPLEHALATQALAESYLICRQKGISFPGLKSAVQQATQWIIDNDHTDGGWCLSFREEGEPGAELHLSIALFHALWMSHQSGIETRNLKRAVEKTLHVIELRQKEDGSVPLSRSGQDLTGGCLFAYGLANRAGHQVTQRAVEFLSGDAPGPFAYKRKSPNLLPLHYEALAMLHFGGASAENWHKKRLPKILKHQRPDGSFEPQSDRPPRYPKEADVQRSSLACLILETPWRYHFNE